MINNQNLFLLPAAALTLIAGFSAKTVLASAGFECDKVWSGPDHNNNVVSCLSDSEHLINLIRDPIRIQYAAGIVIALLIIVICLLCCPFVTCCRYICRCFGGYKRRPGAFCGGSPWDEVDEATKQEAYDKRCRLAVVLAPWIILVACIAPMVLLLNGADTLKDAYVGAFDDFNSITTFVDEKVEGIRGNMTLDNGTLVAPLKQSYFDDAKSTTSDFRKSIYKIRDENVQYVDMTKTGAIVLGCVPILFFVFNALFSLFHCRRCLPLVNSFWMLFLVIVYGLLATVLLIVALLLRDTCGEVGLFNEGRKPGIISWSVVPMCDNTLPFKTITQQIEDAEKSNSKLACENFDTVCSQTVSTYTAADAIAQNKEVFYCPTLPTDHSQCLTFTNVTYHLNRSALKTVSGAPALCSANPCTIYQCAKDCSSADVRERANQTVTYIDYANRALAAFNLHVRPILDCNLVVGVALRAFGSCTKIQDSTWYIGTGSLLFQSYAAVSIIIIWTGQKRWFDPDDKDKDNEPTKEA